MEDFSEKMTLKVICKLSLTVQELIKKDIYEQFAYPFKIDILIVR